MPRPVCEISKDLVRSQNVEESDFKFDSKTSKLVQSWKWPWSASGRGDTGACIWHSSCSNNIFFIEFSLFILVCHWSSNMKRDNFKKWSEWTTLSRVVVFFLNHTFYWCWMKSAKSENDGDLRLKISDFLHTKNANLLIVFSELFAQMSLLWLVWWKSWYESLLHILKKYELEELSAGSKFNNFQAFCCKVGKAASCGQWLQVEQSRWTLMALQTLLTRSYWS